MNKFEGFIDEVLFMAKSAADVASKKTGEVVEIGRLHYQIKQAQWDLEKAYAKLGAIAYQSKRGEEDLAEALDLAMKEIDDLKKKSAEMEEALLAYKKVKKCEKCGQENESNAFYCIKCGAPLDPPEPVEAEEKAEAPTESL
jgi:uncharacterized protein CbrC (UPF0167 family)